jgi:hypothetical protein
VGETVWMVTLTLNSVLNIYVNECTKETETAFLTKRKKYTINNVYQKAIS